jgi:TonB family protein
MAARKAKQLREERSSAIVIAFPMVARRELSESAKLPFPIVPVRRSAPVNSKAAPKAANQNDRPTLPFTRRERWWAAAIAGSVIAHAVIFGLMWERNNYDLERAAGAAAAMSDGATVIPVEVVVTAALPSAPVPVEATEPEEDKVVKEAPKELEESKKEEKLEAAPPQKSDDAAEAVPTAKESPKPREEKREQKKKESSRASRTAAANPSRAAASHSHGRAGAGGHRREAGGNASISSYQAQVVAHLQRYKSYPAAAKSEGTRGIATVRFSLSASGAVISSSLARSSGAGVLDQAALAMVRRASPFPPIPPALGRSRMDFAAPIRFDLH